jgi:DNA modification methylase
MIIWDKRQLGFGWHYHRDYECILVATKRGAPCRWFDTSKRVPNIIRNLGKIIPQAEDHPTPKPPALAGWFVRLHTQPGDVVLDPFCGGGSTGVGALQNNRRFLGIELDGKWISIAEAALERADLNRPFAESGDWR